MKLAAAIALSLLCGITLGVAFNPPLEPSEPPLNVTSVCEGYQVIRWHNGRSTIHIDAR